MALSVGLLSANRLFCVGPPIGSTMDGKRDVGGFPAKRDKLADTLERAEAEIVNC